MPQMVCAVCLGALAGFFLMGGGHASFPGLWAGCLGQCERTGVDLIASRVGLCLFMSLWPVVFSFKTPREDEESVRGKSEGQDAWVPRHDTVPGAGGS